MAEETSLFEDITALYSAIWRKESLNENGDRTYSDSMRSLDTALSSLSDCINKSSSLTNAQDQLAPLAYDLSRRDEYNFEMSRIESRSRSLLDQCGCACRTISTLCDRFHVHNMTKDFDDSNGGYIGLAKCLASEMRDADMVYSGRYPHTLHARDITCCCVRQQLDEVKEKFKAGKPIDTSQLDEIEERIKAVKSIDTSDVSEKDAAILSNTL